MRSELSSALIIIIYIYPLVCVVSYSLSKPITLIGKSFSGPLTLITNVSVRKIKALVSNSYFRLKEKSVNRKKDYVCSSSLKQELTLRAHES